jgi:ribonuclease HI
MHENGKFSIEGSINFLRKYWAELCTIRQLDEHGDLHGKLPVSDSLVAGRKQKTAQEKARWKAPQEGWMKINVDGAFDESSGSGGIGVVIRNYRGEVQLSAWRFIPIGTCAEELEALACREGLMLAADQRIQRAVLETDSSSIAAMLVRKGGDRSPLKFIVDEAREAGDSLAEWTVVYKRRESNSVAHELAQLAKRSRESAVWQLAVPACVEQIIARECTCVSE